MSHPRQVRLAGSVLDRSRHVCAFFHRKEEEYRVLLPFIKEGLVLSLAKQLTGPAAVGEPCTPGQTERSPG